MRNLSRIQFLAVICFLHLGFDIPMDQGQGAVSPAVPNGLALIPDLSSFNLVVLLAALFLALAGAVVLFWMLSSRLRHVADNTPNVQRDGPQGELPAVVDGVDPRARVNIPTPRTDPGRALPEPPLIPAGSFPDQAGSARKPESSPGLPMADRRMIQDEKVISSRGDGQSSEEKREKLVNAEPAPGEQPQENGSDKLTLKVWQGSGEPTEYNLDGLEGILSRGKVGQVCVHDTKVSAPHAVLDISFLKGGADRVRDLGSKNGTWRNDARLPINQWIELQDDDVLEFGRTRMWYNRARQELVYDDDSGQRVSLRGNNRWLITRRQIPLVEFESRDISISVPHMYVRLAGGRLEVRDLSSGNGVIVQGNRIKDREPIFNEDVIQIGRATRIQVVTNISNIPEEIGGWRRLSWNGGGGMADVYRVQHKESGCIRALKIPRPSKYRKLDQLGEKYRQLFQNEIALARQIQHPNLVEAHEWGELPDSRLPYLLMDFIDGPSVSLIIEKLGPMSVADVAEIATQVGKALNTLHVQHHYVHCDVKPSNIMIDFRGHVYLTDLGIATPCGSLLPGLGVPDYLPPEVQHKAPVEPNTDIYSLGKTMFHMLTGQRLSPATIRRDALADLPKTGELHRPATTAGSLLKELSRTTGMQREFAPIIKRCVAPKREKRYRQVADLLAAIEPFRTRANLAALVERTGWTPSTPQE